MNIGLFQATVRDGKPAFRNDAVFRQFIKEFDGEDVEVIVRSKKASKYAALERTTRDEVMNFLDSLVVHEVACFMHCAANSVDSLDIARYLAQERVKMGQPIPESILKLFNLQHTTEPVLFGELASRKAIGEAVSA